MTNNLEEPKRRYQENLFREMKFITKDSTNKNVESEDTHFEIKKKYNVKEDEKLSNSINTETIQNLSEIDKRMDGFSYVQSNKIKKGIRKGQWTVYEDKLLKEWIKQNGPRKWEQCGKYIQGRSGKQCREHWNNCLNPELIKGEWTPEEDYLIMQFYEKCNGSWKKIIYLFNGRTENSIKNRFFSQLRRIATKDMTVEERKYCSKIKLEELKNFVNEAISETKNDFLKRNPMNEIELNNYLNKMELKINKKVLEENENNEINKDKNLIRKRKRSKEDLSEELLDNSTEKENKENKNIKIKNRDENKENNLSIKKVSKEILTKEKGELKIESNNKITLDNSNNDCNLNNYEDSNKNQSKITGIDSRPNNILDDIFDNMDYQYKQCYKFLDNCRPYQTDSLGNIFIVDNSPFYSEKNINFIDKIKDFNEENISLFGNR